MIDAGGKAELEMFFDDIAGQAAHVLVSDATVVRALGRGRVAIFGEAEWAPILVEKILLLKTHPQVRIVFDGRTIVGRMGRAVRVHDFAEDAVGLAALGLHGGTAVKSPQGHIDEGRWFLK